MNLTSPRYSPRAETILEGARFEEKLRLAFSTTHHRYHVNGGRRAPHSNDETPKRAPSAPANELQFSFVPDSRKPEALPILVNCHVEFYRYNT